MSHHNYGSEISINVYIHGNPGYTEALLFWHVRALCPGLLQTLHTCTVFDRQQPESLSSSSRFSLCSICFKASLSLWFVLLKKFFVRSSFSFSSSCERCKRTIFTKEFRYMTYQEMHIWSNIFTLVNRQKLPNPTPNMSFKAIYFLFGERIR